MKEVFKDLWNLSQNITLEGGQALFNKYKNSEFEKLVQTATMALLQFQIEKEEKEAGR